LFESYSSIKSIKHFSSYFNYDYNDKNSINNNLVNDGLDNIREFLLLFYDRNFYSETYCKYLVLKQSILTLSSSDLSLTNGTLPVLSAVILKISSSSENAIVLKLPPLSTNDFINIIFPSPKSRFRILTSSSSSSLSSSLNPSLNSSIFLTNIHQSLSLIDEYVFRETVTEMILSFHGFFLRKKIIKIEINKQF
jgi:hypothetical protein